MLLDPRGRLARSELQLAPRLSRAALAAKPLLFHDNTKMDVGHYGLLFESLKQGLLAHGIPRFVDHRETVRGKSDADLERLAQRFKDMDIGAAIVALADMGVSPAMVRLTVALERLGVPTVCLTAGPGAALCVAHAAYRAGALCLHALELHPGSTAEAVRREADGAVPAVFAMLTTNDAELHALARIGFALDREPVREDGKLAADRDDLEHIQERFDALGIGDGLPLVPPTEEHFSRMRRFCDREPDEVLVAGVGPSGTPIRVRDALVAAVMAGCKPDYVPFVLAAIEAISAPQYNLSQAITTSHGGGHFLLASGPLAAEIGLHGGQGCLGPGFRANATIGRAVNLVLTSVCRSVPGIADLACLGSPAEYSYCMAEPEGADGWMGISAERFGAGSTCVMALMAEAPHSIMDLASTSSASLMETIVDCCTTLGSNNAYVAGALVLVLNPDHGRMLQDAGYDKQRIRQAVHEAAGIAEDRLRSRGLVAMLAITADDAGIRRVTRSPADVEVVVAGGRGGHSAVILPWALHSEPAYQPLRLRSGTLATRLGEYAVPE